jgi:hypothetical protein
MTEKRHCPECNYHLDDYAENETLCGACLDLLTNNNATERGETMETTADNITEEQALDLMWSFARKFGWKGTMFTRDDIRQAIIDQCGESETLDNEITAVMGTRIWTKYLEEAIAREGYECLYEAIYDAENSGEWTDDAATENVFANALERGE